MRQCNKQFDTFQAHYAPKSTRMTAQNIIYHTDLIDFFLWSKTRTEQLVLPVATIGLTFSTNLFQCKFSRKWGMDPHYRMKRGPCYASYAWLIEPSDSMQAVNSGPPKPAPPSTKPT